MEEKNKLDSLVYSTEKTLKDNGDKISAEAKKPVEDALVEVKKQMTSEDPEVLKKAYETLLQASHKMAEEMYKNTTPAGEGAPGAGQPPPADGGAASAGAAGGEKKKDGVVDAEFEEQ